MAKDLYAVLGLNKNTFTEKECKKKYKKLVLKYHPDKQAGKSEEEKQKAAEKFKEVQHAYDILSDPEKRQNYDMFGEAGINYDNAPGGRHNNFNPFSGFASMFGFDGDFDPFSGRRNRGGYGKRIQPGEDVQMKIPVTIEDLFNGLKKTVKYPTKVRCTSCHGKGGTEQITCPKCNGTGVLVIQQSMGQGWMKTQQTVCPECHGSGMTVKNKCSHCHGTGYETKEVTLDIEFPPGIPNDTDVIYYGKGYESRDYHGENGNFIAISKYDIDEDRYMIDGLNVLEHVHIPYYDVLLGCNITVNIPNGTNKSVKIKPCTIDGTVLKLSNEGIKDKMGHKGDYYICVHLLLPEALSTVEKAHLEEIKRSKSNNESP